MSKNKTVTDTQTISANDVLAAAPQGKTKKAGPNMTPEVLAKMEEARKAKKEATKFVLTKLGEENYFADDMRDALVLVIGKKARKALKGESEAAETGKVATIRALFTEKAEVTELELFMAAKVGRAEMRGVSRKLVKCEPAKRIWIAYDAKKEAWIVQGRGETMPKGWKGYDPAKAAE